MAIKIMLSLFLNMIFVGSSPFSDIVKKETLIRIIHIGIKLVRMIKKCWFEEKVKIQFR